MYILMDSTVCCRKGEMIFIFTHVFIAIFTAYLTPRETYRKSTNKSYRCLLSGTD